MNSDERKMLADALKSYHDCAFTPGVYEHSIVGQVALILENYVDVVRCKDCIHYDFGVCLKIYSDGEVSQYAWQARKEDDFCSYGERKDK